MDGTPDSLTAEDLRLLHDEWGFNAVRLGVMWVAVETVQGAINNTFLKRVRGISDIMYEHGIYTLLDGHQDLLGPDREVGEKKIPHELLESARGRGQKAQFRRNGTPASWGRRLVYCKL